MNEEIDIEYETWLQDEKLNKEYEDWCESVDKKEPQNETHD